MKKAVKIILDRAEGPAGSTGITTIEGDDVWAKADKALAAMSRGQLEIGYDKVDFEVHFEGDNAPYKGRFDVRHHSCGLPSLSAHIHQHVSFFAGQMCPDHMEMELYKKIVAARGHDVQPYVDFLRNYDLGNVPSSFAGLQLG